MGGGKLGGGKVGGNRFLVISSCEGMISWLQSLGMWNEPQTGLPAVSKKRRINEEVIQPIQAVRVARGNFFQDVTGVTQKLCLDKTPRNILDKMSMVMTF